MISKSIKQAGTFSQIYIQIVFAVKGRESLICSSWEEALYKYISGVIRNKEQKPLAVNGMADHIHLMVGMKPSCRISDLVREVKKSTNHFINRNNFTRNGFLWQEGYGAFSYSHSNLNNVIDYINRQKEHHHKKTFKEEYLDLLKKFEIEFKEEYLFDWIED